MALSQRELNAIGLLQGLGERRKAHQEQGERLAQEIREALAGTEGVIDRTAAAVLLGVDRTSLYKTYMKP